MSNEDKEIRDWTRAEAESWLNRRSEKLLKYPSLLDVKINEPLRENDVVSVNIYPNKYLRDRMGRFKEPRYKKGYEIPVCLFKEPLTQAIIRRLGKALEKLRYLQRLDAVQGLAFMTHLYLFEIDRARAGLGNDLFVFSIPTYGELSAISHMEAANQIKKCEENPIASLDNLLNSWDFRGILCAEDFIKVTVGNSGPIRLSYLTIPPSPVEGVVVGGFAIDKDQPLKDPALAVIARHYAELGTGPHVMDPTKMESIVFIDKENLKTTKPLGPTEEPSKKDFTADQRADYGKYEYKCSDRLDIPGTFPKERSNNIVLNENQITLGDSLFAILMRFVVELKKGREGWVAISNLAAEQFINNVEHRQPISNLRSALKGSLKVKNAKQFIECKSKRYRLSVHPDFITYDKERLKIHPDPIIKKLARKLL